MSNNLEATVASLGMDLTAEQLMQLESFRDLLAVSANEFNLTSLRDPESIERRHIVESLAFAAFLHKHRLMPEADGAKEPLRVLDIGTGAGLPGIPLKLAEPSVHLTLLESVGKKCRFMERAVETLRLRDVEVVEARAEDFSGDPARREQYDLVVARAVAPLPVLLEYALPALRIDGWLAAPKGSAALSEIDASTAALATLGGRLHDAAPFEPPDGMRQTVALVQKVAATPERYPRRAGIPSKRPL